MLAPEKALTGLLYPPMPQACGDGGKAEVMGGTVIRIPWRVVAVTGDSMSPALRPGDALIVRRGGRVTAGDLVVARHPERPDTLTVKRATFRDGDGWWLESDNQRARGRRDSWNWGAVPDRLVIGRVVACYWPPSRASVFRPST